MVNNDFFSLNFETVLFVLWYEKDDTLVPAEGLELSLKGVKCGKSDKTPQDK